MASYFAGLRQAAKPLPPAVATAECIDPGPFFAPTPAKRATESSRSKATEAELNAQRLN